MTAIIFGANGQDGFYLSKLLLQQSLNVIGVSRSGHFLRTDIADFADVSNLIKHHQPDFIFHLAANSTTRHDALFENHQTIATGTLNILESVKNYSPKTKVFISGSGLQFKNEGKPIKETDEFAANDAYAVSRIQSVYAARYFRKLGVKVYTGYFYNHDSSFRTERHVTKMISSTVKRISEGSKEKLIIGDDSVIKEWSYAGDIVKGIWLLVTQENIYEANISSGKGYSISEWIDLCFKITGLNSTGLIEKNPTFKSDYKMLVSDNGVVSTLGYQPAVDFAELAFRMINNLE